MTKYITSTPNVIGGKPAIVGTRIPISRILFLLKAGYPLEAIHDQYPWVDIHVVAGAIDEITELVNNSPDVRKVPQTHAAGNVSFSKGRDFAEPAKLFCKTDP